MPFKSASCGSLRRWSKASARRKAPDISERLRRAGGIRHAVGGSEPESLEVSSCFLAPQTRSPARAQVSEILELLRYIVCFPGESFLTSLPRSIQCLNPAGLGMGWIFKDGGGSIVASPVQQAGVSLRSSSVAPTAMYEAE